MSGSIAAAGWHLTGALLAPALRLNLRRRARSGREIAARLDERQGIDPAPRPDGRLLWMHAASVGETQSILPVLSALVPRTHVLLTTGTVTSQDLLARRLPELGLDRHVLPRFAPLDVPAWVDRFLAHWRPDAACFVESELWPNQLAACRAAGIPLVLINARMSDRSFARWRRVPGIARHLLGAFAHIQARGQQDADRLRALGATSVDCPGDLKFAAAPLPVDQVELDRLTAALAGRPVWLAASTHPGEEAQIATVHQALAPAWPGLITIVAPRHPQRGPALAAELRAARRGAGEGPPGMAGLWITDTVGEMGLWYRLAPIAFVGRSLLPPGGGQNPLEPARLGCAIAAGPHMGNFAHAVSVLEQAGGLRRVANGPDLAAFVRAMLADPDARRRMGERAAAVIQRHADLPARTAEALLALMPA
ncbi:3-deoxy-D-manno-octulosonic acid transferase [Rhodopila sp.]|jgi:3-deoxy-D-manno-octulosonic-acid transferase|uniref:3-deoxy-D-manno-octulosonic acid transferase n=1 Tax=Rhodopila sp. TaxID=2480087 RepID=UPI002CF55F88|nr:3-deoxy-D-manno-octulosonic acid transferase [Rhodopila sp.]HVZ06969.1 3-deoxy-D-manno-octulosonic acid transferase [Rhodopila sp.]